MAAFRASLLAVALLVAGCGPHDTPVTKMAPASPVAVADPDHKLYEQLRAGIYQLSSAQDSLQTATELSTELSKKAGGTASGGFKDLLAKLNSAGQKLGDYTDELPPFDEFKKDVAGQDDRRLNAIQAGNDSLSEMGDADDILDNLLAGAPADFKADVQKIQSDLDDASEAVQSGIVALGGKVEEDDTATPGTAGNNAGG